VLIAWAGSEPCSVRMVNAWPALTKMLSKQNSGHCLRV
jgi:hypothetical protein